MTEKVFKKLRLTRNELYLHNCQAKDDVTARQGYYFSNSTIDHALREMRVSYGETLYTVEDYSENEILGVYAVSKYDYCSKVCDFQYIKY